MTPSPKPQRSSPCSRLVFSRLERWSVVPYPSLPMKFISSLPAIPGTICVGLNTQLLSLFLLPLRFSLPCAAVCGAKKTFSPASSDETRPPRFCIKDPGRTVPSFTVLVCWRQGVLFPLLYPLDLSRSTDPSILPLPLLYNPLRPPLKPWTFFESPPNSP